VAEFNEMRRKYKIELPTGWAKGWTDEQITAMAQVSIKLEHMWNHAIGTDWKTKVTLDTVKDLFRRM
jgi:3-deoxy-alpha-D-manno-octulosonate 8-oxidase